MTKNEYYIKALHEKAYEMGHWRSSVFLRTTEPDDYWKKDPYEYRLVLTTSGYMYVQSGELVPISDGQDVSSSLLNVLDRIDLPANTFSNQPDAINTAYGNVLVNSTILLSSVGDVIKFQTGRVNIEDLGDQIAAILVDDPADGGTVKGHVTCAQLDDFVTATLMFEDMGRYVVHAATAKNVLAPKGMDAFRNKLLKKYKGKLSDPIEAVRYENELRDFDSEYLKGDPSDGIMISGKVRNTARVKMHMSAGNNPGFTTELSNTYQEKSLANPKPETKEEHATSMSSVRAASYFRGVLTQVGGTASKLLTRALSYITVTDDDCKTKRTFSVLINKFNYKSQANLYRVVGGKAVIISPKDAKSLIGTVIKRRTPLYCDKKRATLCRKCAGDNMYRYKKGIQVSGMSIGGTIIYYSFAKLKGTTYTIIDVDLMEAVQ